MALKIKAAREYNNQNCSPKGGKEAAITADPPPCVNGASLLAIFI